MEDKRANIPVRHSLHASSRRTQEPPLGGRKSSPWRDARAFPWRDGRAPPGGTEEPPMEGHKRLPHGGAQEPSPHGGTQEPPLEGRKNPPLEGRKNPPCRDARAPPGGTQSSLSLHSASNVMYNVPYVLTLMSEGTVLITRQILTCEVIDLRRNCYIGLSRNGLL